MASLFRWAIAAACPLVLLVDAAGSAPAAEAAETIAEPPGGSRPPNVVLVFTDDK
jgi:hypothetical protein